MKSCVITGICTAWSAVCIPDGTAGHINHAYNENFRRLAKRYAGMQCIRTVCGSSKTGVWHRNVFYWKRELLIRLGRLG